MNLYIKYLALRTFMDCNMPASWDNNYSKDNEGWYSNGEKFKIDLNKVKEDLAELEKILFGTYVINNTEKSE